MHIPRLSESLVTNDIVLVTLGMLVLLLGIWAGVVGGSIAIRWLFRTSGVQWLARLGDGVARLARTIALVLSALTVVAGLVLLSFGIWQELDFQRWAERGAEKLTSQALWFALREAAILAGLGTVAWYFFGLRKHLLPRVQERLTRLETLADQKDAIAKTFVDLPATLSLLIVFGFIEVAGAALGLPEGLHWWMVTVCLIALVASVTRLGVQIGTLALSVSDALTHTRIQETIAKVYYDEVQPLMPLAQRVLEAMIYLTGAIVVIRRFDTNAMFAPYGAMAMQLIVTFFVARTLIALVGVAVLRFLSRWQDDVKKSEDTASDDMKREEAHARRLTLSRLTQSLMRFVIYVIMIMVMLVIVGVDPLPLLAGAGVVGFAVGLGSQKILEDIICGFFMLLEDQMLIGDYIKIGETEGVVEQLHLRVSRIRDRYGRVHTVRNGDVSNVINYSRGWTLAVIEMGVAFESDLSEVFRVLAQAGKTLHEQRPEQVLEPSEVMGVTAIDESCLRVRIETRVRPGCHFAAKNELNRLILEGFVANGIEIPYPKGVELDGVPRHPRWPEPDDSAPLRSAAG